MIITKLFANGVISKPDSIPRVDATQDKLASIITYAGVVAAVICVLVIVIAGFLLVISAGEPDKITKSKLTIIYAVVGLVVSLSATVIASFVARSVG